MRHVVRQATHSWAPSLRPLRSTPGPWSSYTEWPATKHTRRPFACTSTRCGVGRGDESATSEREKQRPIASKSAQRKADDRPWQRVSSNTLPEANSSDPSRGDKTKGNGDLADSSAFGEEEKQLTKAGTLLTTPTRLLKLILPMPFHPDQEHINTDAKQADESRRETVEPLALLMHPQQPLSYLERLIQAEIPPVRVNGRERLPEIVFRAEAGLQENKAPENDDRGANVAQYSGLGHEGPSKSEANWVRWSSSTEVGDFIRDAARGQEFAIAIEGLPHELRVAVPSFKDRTYYMRTRLRRMSREIDQMSRIKKECDELAHKEAYRLAKGGFAALAAWWGVIYYSTFHTEWGWDLVEPVTYLAGLATIMAGYLWFLFISRDLSYKAAMRLTVSRRQNALYQERGFDQQKWDQRVQEANALRKEIKVAATEYDVDWDEAKDLGGEEVKEILEQERHDRKKQKQKLAKATQGEEEDDDEEGAAEEDKEGSGNASSTQARKQQSS